MATGEMTIMDHTGDTKLIWDSAKPDEVANAKKTFKDLKSKGYIAYRVKGEGGKASAMGDFDPEAEKMIMSAPMAGG